MGRSRIPFAPTTCEPCNIRFHDKKVYDRHMRGIGHQLPGPERGVPSSSSSMNVEGSGSGPRSILDHDDWGGGGDHDHEVGGDAALADPVEPIGEEEPVRALEPEVPPPREEKEMEYAEYMNRGPNMGSVHANKNKEKERERGKKKNQSGRLQLNSTLIV